MARRVGGFWTAAVVDADPEATPPWLATEYVVGPSLSQAVAEHGPLPERSVRRLAAGLAEALTAIHRAGLVHRDLKPSNVLLGADGPRVIDFGIALASGSTTLTSTGVFLGTPGFLSPEQLVGGEVGPASDVFSLGALLIFACTGNAPFGEGDTSMLFHRATHGTPDLRGVPEGMLAPINACLRRDPAQRPTPARLLSSLGDGESLTPAPEAWLPTPVATLVHEQHTALRENGIVRGGHAPSTRVSHAAGPPRRPAASATGSGRASQVLWGCVLLIAAVVLWHSGHRFFGIGLGYGLFDRTFTVAGVLGCFGAGVALLVHAARQ
jgi:serine/threonine protein kinase